MLSCISILIVLVVFSSSELKGDVSPLALSDLPRSGLLSGELSFDGSASDATPVDCCFLLRYSDIDNYNITIKLS